MAKVLALVLALVMWCTWAPAAQADVAGLIPCRESAAFQQRLASEVATQEARLSLYAAGSPRRRQCSGGLTKRKPVLTAMPSRGCCVETMGYPI
jgi:hypothetical protein